MPFGQGTIIDNGGGRSTPRPGGMLGFLSNIAPAIPIVGGIASNILAGINERKARAYNSPINQVKRLREAGLPLAAGSNITAGGGVSTKVGSLGTEGFNDNLGKSIMRAIDRNKLRLQEQEIISAKAAADIAAGNAKNQLNPTGVYENTNQGAGIQQTLAQQAEAVKTAELINKWMPIEKAQGVLKNTKEIAKISADTANSLAQNNILVSEGKIKSILANWQARMSQHEFNNLILRNTGIKNHNEISAIQGEILRNTKIAQIHKAQMDAVISGQTMAANQMSLILQGLETEAAKAYYKVRARVDANYKGGFWDVINPTDLIYLKLMTPTQSNIRGGMPSLPSGGNTYNTHNYIKTKEE